VILQEQDSDGLNGLIVSTLIYYNFCVSLLYVASTDFRNVTPFSVGVVMKSDRENRLILPRLYDDVAKTRYNAIVGFDKTPSREKQGCAVLVFKNEVNQYLSLDGLPHVVSVALLVSFHLVLANCC